MSLGIAATLWPDRPDLRERILAGPIKTVRRAPDGCRSRVLVQRMCAWCGAPFRRETNAANAVRVRFCCDACMRAHNSYQKAERRRMRKR